MNDRFAQKTLLLLAGIWLAYTLLAVFCRPLLPIDETRYVSVAWEMFYRGNWILPTLNYLPYAHKPPLLFWLIDAVWTVLGPSHWGATFALSLMSFLCVVLTAVLAGRLFPEDKKLPGIAALLLIFSAPFMIYGTLVMFDFLLTVCVLGAMIGTVMYARTGAFRYVLLMGLAMGFGVLAKGPVIVLDSVFPWLLAPLWARELPGYRGRAAKWYLMLLPVLLIATLIGLSWAVPAALLGGPEYSQMIFWNQTAGRMVQAFDHRRPFWFYMPYLPLIVVPWIFLPSFWQAVKQGKPLLAESPVRFLLCWIVPVFIAFSAVSGKQLHYLVPLFPAMAILLARALSAVPAFQTVRLWQAGVPVLLILCTFQIAGKYTFFKPYDLQPVATALEPYKSLPIAFVRKYQAEVTFPARLTHTIDSLEIGELKGWFVLHPAGVALVRYSRKDPGYIRDFEPVFTMEYKGGKNLSIVKMKDGL